VSSSSEVSRKLTLRGFRNKANIHLTAQICGGKVKMGAEVKEGARVGMKAFVGRKAIIGKNAVLEDGVKVGMISEVGDFALVEKRATIGSFASIGAHARIGMNAKIASFVKIDDYRIIANERNIEHRPRRVLHGQFTQEQPAVIRNPIVLNIPIIINSDECKQLIENNQGISILAANINQVNEADLALRAKACFDKVLIQKALGDDLKKNKDELTRLQAEAPAKDAAQQAEKEDEIEGLSEKVDNLESQIGDCSICLTCLAEKPKLVETQCNHLFCHDCFTDLMKSAAEKGLENAAKGERAKACPLCRGPNCDQNHLEIELLD
jgi:carbonic anhydrase/acetyltransferase-like protein (isoleucine patch superfamily)